MTTAIRDPQRRLLVRALLVTVALLILVTGIAIGLAIGQFSADAAPGEVSACVNNYTGAVRMSPYGVTNCSATETQITWPGIDTIGLHDVYQISYTTSVDGGSTHQVVRACDDGDVALSGGYEISPSSQLFVITSHQFASGGSWDIVVRNPGPIAEDLEVFVVCATP